MRADKASDTWCVNRLVSEKAPGSGGRENEWANWGCEGLGVSDGSLTGEPTLRVRGPVGGIAGQVSTFSLGGEVCKEDLVALGPGPRDQEELWHWAFRPPSPRHKCSHGGLASGSKEMSPHQSSHIKNGP